MLQPCRNHWKTQQSRACAAQIKKNMLQASFTFGPGIPNSNLPLASTPASACRPSQVAQIQHGEVAALFGAGSRTRRHVHPGRVDLVLSTRAEIRSFCHQ